MRLRTVTSTFGYTFPSGIPHRASVTLVRADAQMGHRVLVERGALGKGGATLLARVRALASVRYLVGFQLSCKVKFTL